ncbi:MAG: hypothetical protein ABEK04_00420 [Candidatus Nanohalobium sp.]
MKGQVSIEFLASFFLYLLAIVAVFQVISGDIPQFNKSLEQKSLHFEARYVTDQMLTQTGYHTFGDGGTNWQKNQSTMSSIKNFGLASEYLVVDEDKLGNISTVGKSKFNYSQFRRAVGAENQYQFRFVLMPMVEAYKTFKKGNPPGSIQEPNSGLYSSARETVHYGSIRINGQEAYFLITAHSTGYNTTYVSSSWDFRGATPLAEDDKFTVNGRTFSVENIQDDRRYDKGSLLILRREVKQFGASIDTTETTIKLNRYVSYKAEGSELEPMRVEVIVW